MQWSRVEVVEVAAEERAKRKVETGHNLRMKKNGTLSPASTNPEAGGNEVIIATSCCRKNTLDDGACKIAFVPREPEMMSRAGCKAD